MARRSRATKRSVTQDSAYDSTLVQQIINKVLRDGQKSLSERITYDALEIIGEQSGQDPIKMVNKSIEGLTPKLEVRSRRVGGATYQVPIEVAPRRGRTLAVRWLIQFARQRKERSMAERLAKEMLDACEGQGGAFKKKEDVLRMAQANKAFAHYRW